MLVPIGGHRSLSLLLRLVHVDNVCLLPSRSVLRELEPAISMHLKWAFPDHLKITAVGHDILAIINDPSLDPSLAPQLRIIDVTWALELEAVRDPLCWFFDVPECADRILDFSS